jgi:prepilin-type N-terminal cleavage/methylation domain-containing protein
MRSASIGTPAALRSSRTEGNEQRAGFTLLEALVALALVLAFAAALGPYLFQARRIMVDAEGRVAAQVLLRTLLDAPFDRGSLASGAREGEAGGLRWRIVTEPLVIATGAPRDRPNWSAFRVVASVAWGPRQVISAETMRLGKAE